MESRPIESHLLMSCFVTNSGLSQYRLGYVSTGEVTFRLGRLMTSLSSMAELSWKTASFYLKFDADLANFEAQVRHFIDIHFPGAQVHNYRLELPREWRAALAGYEHNDLVLLQANDDHALVPDGASSLLELTQAMLLTPKASLGLVSHYPEFSGMHSRERLKNLLSCRPLPHPRGFMMNYSIGTVLARASELQGWFQLGNLPEAEKIVRPDNPFGPSIVFPEALCLIPNSEVFRHLDGYSHIGLFSEVPPLRNTWTLSGDPLGQIEPWKTGLWPTKLLANSGTGADFFQTSSTGSSRLQQISIAIARLKLNWGVRIAFADCEKIRINHGQIAFFPFYLGVLGYVFSPAGIFKVLDKMILDPILLGLLLPLSSRITGANLLLREVWYLGSTKAILRKVTHEARKSNLNRRK